MFLVTVNLVKGTCTTVAHFFARDIDCIGKLYWKPIDFCPVDNFPSPLIDLIELSFVFNILV